MSSYEIIKTVNVNGVLDMFRDAKRDHYSYDAMEKILDNEKELSQNGQIDLDIVAICGCYTEYTLDQLKGDYSSQYKEAQEEKGDLDDEDEVIEYFIELIEGEVTRITKLDNDNYLVNH